MARRRARHDPYAPRRFEPLEPPTGPEAMDRRHQRVQIEVTPVTHFAPSRGYKHDRRDDDPSFFPQRQPQGMQGYGSTEDVHTQKGNLALQHAELLATSGARHAAAGDCGEGRRKLNGAHAAIGAADAHSASGGRVDALTLVATTVDRAEEHFAKFCKIKKRRK